MQKNTLLLAAAGILVLVGAYVVVSKESAPAPVVETTAAPVYEMPIKEFTMTAYYDEKGKWFSLNEMTVKKGDMVRVHITNTKGMHDFVIDELGVSKELPLNEEVTISFVASTVGDLVYYCSKPGHRAGGQWGTLHVTE
jgi:uncharacterized cupredoxin-like copper-binding protein